MRPTFYLSEKRTNWCLNRLIKVKQNARKWKFELKSRLEERENYLGWCIWNTCAENKDKSLRMSWSTCKGTFFDGYIIISNPGRYCDALERKFKLIRNEYDVYLNIFRLHLEVLRCRDFFAAGFKVERAITVMIKSSAIDDKFKKQCQILWLLYWFFWRSQILMQLQKEASQIWSSLKVTWERVFLKIAYPICPSFQLNMKQWRG